jgi:hypothetical protein
LRGDNLIEVELLTEALEHGAPVWIAPPILGQFLSLDVALKCIEYQLVILKLAA